MMNNSKKIIVVVGSSNTDMVIKSSRLPKHGETIIGEHFFMAHGGKGANQAVAAARLGAKVVFISKTGDDIFRSRSVEQYGNDGIDTRYVFSDLETPSGVALIMVNSEGENIISVAPGANYSLSPEDIDRAYGAIAASGIVLMQLEILLETVLYVAGIARETGALVVLNPAPARELPDSLYASVDVLIPNRTEAELLSGIEITGWEDAERAAKILLAKGVGTVVITLGELGALLLDEAKTLRIPTKGVCAVDTTGAGDTFCGALCVALSEGRSFEDGIKFANLSAGIAVSRMGAQPSIPYRREVNAVMNKRATAIVRKDQKAAGPYEMKQKD